MEKNRRAHYRVTPDPREGLEVAILHRLGEEIAREIVDLSIDGAGTRFPVDAAPKLAVGDVVRLTLRSPELAEPIEVEAAVVHQHELHRHRHVNFRFRNRSNLERGLPSRLYRLLNRRSAYRAPVETTDDPVQVGIAVPKEHTPAFKGIARLSNISATGLGALAPRAVEDVLAGVQTVELELRFPGSDRALDLVALIRNRELHDETVYYGVKFDAGLTPDFLDKAEDIVAYILARRERNPGRVGGTLH